MNAEIFEKLSDKDQKIVLEGNDDSNAVEEKFEIAQELINEISENNASGEFKENILHLDDELGDIDSTFSAITGKIVFDENAKQIGVAKQVGVNSKNEVVLVITDNYGNDKSVDWQKIKKIGEIVLLGNTVTERENIPAPDGLRCSNCNFDNKSDAKFCENCGSKV